MVALVQSGDVGLDHDAEDRLVSKAPDYGELIEADIGRGLRCRVPLTLPCSDSGTIGGDPAALRALKAKLAEIPMEDLDGSELRTRLAATVIT